MASFWNHPWSAIVLSALSVAAGAVLGAWSRWGLALWLNHPDSRLPWGTLLANLAGGLLIGLALGVLARHPEWSPNVRLFAITGFLGALTTFSTFSAESLALIQRGDLSGALLHTALHTAGALAAAACGMWLATVLNPRI